MKEELQYFPQQKPLDHLPVQSVPEFSSLDLGTQTSYCTRCIECVLSSIVGHRTISTSPINRERQHKREVVLLSRISFSIPPHILAGIAAYR